MYLLAPQMAAIAESRCLNLREEPIPQTACSIGRPLISARHNTMHIHCAGSSTMPAQDLHRAGKSIQY